LLALSVRKDKEGVIKMNISENNEIQFATGARKLLDAVFLVTDEKTGFKSHDLKVKLRKSAVNLFKSVLDSFESCDYLFKKSQASKIRGYIIEIQFGLCEALEEGSLERKNFFKMLFMTKILL